MQRLCRNPSEHVAEILVPWQALTTEEPWHGLAVRHRIDDIPELTLALIDAAVCASRAEHVHAVERLIQAAVAHARHRREAGLPHDLLLTEYYLLREAMWRHVRGLGSALETTIHSVDFAVSAATRASMIAFHESEMGPGRAAELLAEIGRDALDALGTSR